jgi:2-hydroxy-3-keto-5-methylthiopentenyl-1-phosphate phosphatase
VLPVRALVVDFDGTACLQDVSEELLVAFGDPGWPEYDHMVDHGEMGLREAAKRQSSMLSGSREEMLAYALEHAEMDPTFAPFVRWAETLDMPLALVSDGFAFYIRPILESAGLGHVRVVTNELSFEGGRPALSHPNGHPGCIGCGTCKMLAVQRFQRDHGPVAFVGEGQSDRYGALYADVVFAKLALVELCERDGVPFRPWSSFDDVRADLEALHDLPGPVAPVACPGWIPISGSPTD